MKPEPTHGAAAVKPSLSDRNRFAISSRPASAAPPRRCLPAGRRSPAVRLRALAVARDRAWLRWWRLYNAPDLRADPGKWHAMLRARIAYQDASVAWMQAVRDSQQRQTLL